MAAREQREQAYGCYFFFFLIHSHLIPIWLMNHLSKALCRTQMTYMSGFQCNKYFDFYYSGFCLSWMFWSVIGRTHWTYKMFIVWKHQWSFKKKPSCGTFWLWVFWEISVILLSLEADEEHHVNKDHLLLSVLRKQEEEQWGHLISLPAAFRLPSVWSGELLANLKYL